LQAAILLPKLAVMDREVASRQWVADRYIDFFSKLHRCEYDLAIRPPHIESYNTSAWAQFTIQARDRDALQEKLKKAGIPTAIYYPMPLNRQPAVADSEAQLPVGDLMAQRVMSLPMHSYLDIVHINKIAEILTQDNLV
jgi:UDP-2-acetamido-2-deoxy-ribo-hexuluronate aminotransferase